MKFIKTSVNQRLLIKRVRNQKIYEDNRNDVYEVQKVKGYLCGDKGLNIVKGHKSWMVSHQSSGFLLCELPLPFALAKQAVELLSDIIDWTRHEDEVLEQAVFGSDNNVLIKKIRFIQPETALQTLEEVKIKLNARKLKKPWEM